MSEAANVAGFSVPPGPLPGFDGLYGLRLEAISETEVTASIAIEDHHLQPAGLVHGGVVASMAESMASFATHLAVSEDGMVAQGLSNHTSFLRPLTGPAIHAVARRRHRGRSTWVWEVDVCDDRDRLCALVRMTVAVREGAQEPAGR